MAPVALLNLGGGEGGCYGRARAPPKRGRGSSRGGSGGSSGSWGNSSRYLFVQRSNSGCTSSCSSWFSVGRCGY